MSRGMGQYNVVPCPVKIGLSKISSHNAKRSFTECVAVFNDGLGGVISFVCLIVLEVFTCTTEATDT